MNFSNEDSELLSLIDEHDTVIGSITRKESSRLTVAGGKFIRSADGFIVRSDNRVWVPIRGKHKKIAPGGLDYSVGAHVQKGESYLEAIVREANEEAGIEVTPSQCVKIGQSTPFNTSIDTPLYSTLFVIKTDASPVLSEEHVSGTFMTIPEIESKIATGISVKGYYPGDIVKLQKYLEQYRD